MNYWPITACRQVMAIIHSMMELGCSQKQTREFLYRMCVIHQLSESQRLQLLEHTLRGQWPDLTSSNQPPFLIANLKAERHSLAQALNRLSRFTNLFMLYDLTYSIKTRLYFELTSFLLESFFAIKCKDIETGRIQYVWLELIYK